MVKNLSKVLKILISEQRSLAATLYFEQVYVFCILINKNKLEWFLQIICKENTPTRSANLFIRRKSADTQYKTVTRFFNKQHFYKQRQAEIGKNKQKAKQHP